MTSFPAIFLSFPGIFQQFPEIGLEGGGRILRSGHGRRRRKREIRSAQIMGMEEDFRHEKTTHKDG